MTLKEFLQRAGKNGFSQLGIIGIIAAVVVLVVGGFVGYEYIRLQNLERSLGELSTLQGGEKLKPKPADSKERIAPIETKEEVEKTAPVLPPPPVVSPPQNHPPPQPLPKLQMTPIMVVASQKGDEFYDVAKYFAEKKNARLLIFGTIADLISQLRKSPPIYLTIVLSPKALTADFIDELDIAVRKIDTDPYFDVAYGIITAFDKEEGFRYVDRLLKHKPKSDPSIYGINQYPVIRWLGDIYGYKFQDRCVGGYGFAVCDDTQRATVDRLVAELPGKNIVNLGLHGVPSEMNLESESLVGSRDGLMGRISTSETECIISGQTQTCGPKYFYKKLNFDADLVTAYSCTTARIVGKPSIIKKEFGDSDVEGKIENSVALSVLKSGALSYIGASHVANTAILPLQQIAEKAVVQGVPIGVALKDFKNDYVFNKIFQQRTFPGKPAASPFTIDFIEFQLRNWIFFGDPSLQLTTEKGIPQNCIKEYVEKANPQGKEIAIKIKFVENGRALANTHLLNLLDDNTSGASGNDACAVHVSIEGNLNDFSITTQGINSRFQSMFSKTGGVIENLVDELLVIVPDFVLEGGDYGEARLNIMMTTR